MPSISAIVDDATIQKFKDAVTEYQRIRKEVALSKEAGIDTGYTVKDIDDKIAATVKIIEAYTGMPYRP